MLEDQETIQISRTQIMNWENDSLFTDGLQCNTDPELDPDRTVGSVLTPEQKEHAERKARRRNQRLIIIAIRKMAYDLQNKSKLDKEQNRVLKPIYNLATNLRTKIIVLVGLMFTALVLGVWNLVLSYFGVGGG